MKNFSNSKYCAAIIRCYFVLCITLCVSVSFCLIRYITVDTNNTQNTQKSDTLTYERDPLRLVHQSTQMIWKKQEFLVIFGIPSLEIPIRHWRRRLQRVTCWQFPEVAARHNNFTGALFPLYLLARHPINNFTLSTQLVHEAEQWQDILIYPKNEGRPSAKKIVTDNGYWGLEAEIGSSQKTFFWFQFALRQFPRVPYVGKGDDDTFLCVPHYLADLRLLPIKRIYWGLYRNLTLAINKNGKQGGVKYMHGFCSTLSRDTAESFASYKPFQNIMSLPYSKEMESDFIAMNMQYEDVMIGRLLQEVNFPVIYINDGYYRFWLKPYLPPNEKVVAVHKPKEHEYYKFTSRVMNYKRPPNSTQIIKEGPDFYFIKNLN